MKSYCSLLFFVCVSMVSMETPKQKAQRTQIEQLYTNIEQDYTQQVDDLLTKFEFTRTEKSLALINAIQLKKPNCVAVLLGHHVDVNSGNTRKQTPLLEAVLSRQVSVIEWLLISGADPSRRSLLSNFADIPSRLECEASDSDNNYITPLVLAQARCQSRRANQTDRRIANMLLRPVQAWQDPALKAKIAVTSSSCLEAIRHSDNYALLEYLKSCKYSEIFRKRYLIERLKLAAEMRNFPAMDILIKEGAACDPVFQDCVSRLDLHSIRFFIQKQYVDDLQIEKALKRACDLEPGSDVSPYNDTFAQKKLKTVATLRDSHTLLFESMPSGNIAVQLKRREQLGIPL